MMKIYKNREPYKTDKTSKHCTICVMFLRFGSCLNHKINKTNSDQNNEILILNYLSARVEKCSTNGVTCLTTLIIGDVRPNTCAQLVI